MAISREALMTAPSNGTSPCQPLGDDDNLLFITETCEDPVLNQPYTDVDEQRSTTDPATGVTVSYRYIHGGFTGTNTRFSLYFPPKGRYEGRFFQGTYPTVTVDETSPAAIAFGVSHGAYVVSTNNNGGLPAGLPLAAYRANAAAAKYSRVVAERVYGSVDRPRGYLFGASGGAFQTIGAVENSDGVWDGSIPMVLSTPNAIPSYQAIQVLGLRALHDRLPRIVDALEPGGSGDPYAGLEPSEREALTEVTRFGFPRRGWWQYETLTGGSFSVVAGTVRALDPTYVDDFWNQPGYEGSDSSVQAARVQQDAKVVSMVDAPEGAEAWDPSTGQVIAQINPTIGAVLSSVAPGELLTGADLTVTSGVAVDKALTIATVQGNTVHFSGDSDLAVTSAIQPGDTVRIDNSWSVALQYYPRHQVPTADMYGWNQYRDAAGEPLYPQRPLLVGQLLAAATGGAVATGRFHGKMIVLASLHDIEAFPWSSDWYRGQAEQAVGGDVHDRFRLWFMDNAGHAEPRTPHAPTHVVDYDGELQQALLDLDAWVADGVPPPASTTYRIDDDTQVQVPPTAADRNGIQPVVSLTVNGGETAEVEVGEAVHFTAEAELPEGTGAIVSAEWDFDGSGDFTQHAQPDRAASAVTMTASHTYDRPETYFAVVRMTARRDGDADAPYRRIANLARVRVIVR
jgi:hypothetical protein